MKMISEMEKQHHTEANALQVRLDKLLSDMPELVAERATLRARNEELENIESQRVRQIEASKEDIERLRLRNRELDNSKFELEKQVQKQEVQMDGLKQQLQDKEDVVEQMSRRLEAAGRTQGGGRGRRQGEAVGQRRQMGSSGRQKFTCKSSLPLGWRKE